jgi:hypothetical protein
MVSTVAMRFARSRGVRVDFHYSFYAIQHRGAATQAAARGGGIFDGIEF